MKNLRFHLFKSMNSDKDSENEEDVTIFVVVTSHALDSSANC